MMGVELFVQVFLDSALLSACVFGTLGWQGRLRNCVLAGNFVICLLSRLTGYSTDPVAYVVVPLDNFVFVLFLLLAVPHIQAKNRRSDQVVQVQQSTLLSEAGKAQIAW